MLAQLLQLPPGTPGVKQAVMELQKELLKACKRGERAQKEVLLLQGAVARCCVMALLSPYEPLMRSWAGEGGGGGNDTWECSGRFTASRIDGAAVVQEQGVWEHRILGMMSISCCFCRKGIS